MLTLNNKIRACTVLALLIVLRSYSQTTTRVNAREDSPELRLTNAQYFTEYNDFSSVLSLLSLPDNADRKSIVITRTVSPHSTTGTGRSPERSSYLQAQAANADLVITGRPLHHFSTLTSDQSFVFTDYVFQVDEVEKDPAQSINPGDHLVIARAGGVLSYKGKTIQAIDPDFPLFDDGVRYTLFLHALPGGTAFKATADGTFLLNNGRALPGRSSHVLSKSEAEFSEDVYSAIAATRR